MEFAEIIKQPYEIHDWKFDKVSKKWHEEIKKIKLIYKLKEIEVI